MTSPEHVFFVNCKFCQSYIPTSKARDFTFMNDKKELSHVIISSKTVKFTCNECNYRSESMMYTKSYVDKELRRLCTKKTLDNS